MKEVRNEKDLTVDVPAGSENIPEALGDDELIAALVESNSITAVALLRIYDVLACIYGELNEADAAELVKLHAQGKLRSQLPFLDMS